MRQVKFGHLILLIVAFPILSSGTDLTPAIDDILEPESNEQTSGTVPPQRSVPQPVSGETEPPAAAVATSTTQEQQPSSETEKKPAPKEEQEATPKKGEKKFVKGEIANIGARDIVYPYNSIGIGTGVTFIDQDIFLTLDPRFVYNKNDFNMLMAFHLPINIRMFSFDLNRAGEDNFTLRQEDWDEWQDYFRIIKYVQYGRSEDTLYASIGSNNAQSLGHGTIMKRYVPNFDPNFTKVSAKLNHYNDYLGFETVLGDVTDGNMFGALFFVKPLSWLAKNEGDYMPRSFSIGFTTDETRLCGLCVRSAGAGHRRHGRQRSTLAGEFASPYCGRCERASDCALRHFPLPHGTRCRVQIFQERLCGLQDLS